MGGKAKDLEGAGDIESVKVIVEAEEDLDLRNRVPILLCDCTHLDGIVWLMDL